MHDARMYEYLRMGVRVCDLTTRWFFALRQSAIILVIDILYMYLSRMVYNIQRIRGEQLMMVCPSRQ